MDDVIQLSLAVRGDMLYVDCTLPESETSIALHEDVVMDQLDSDCVRVGEDAGNLYRVHLRPSPGPPSPVP